VRAKGGESTRGRIDQGANEPGGEWSRRRMVHHVGESSMGRNVEWAKRLETVEMAHLIKSNYFWTNKINIYDLQGHG